MGEPRRAVYGCAHADRPPGVGRAGVGGRGAVAASEFIAGPLADNPYRVGKELNAPYEGVWSARLMREWRILYVIDPEQRFVVVRDVARRRYVYRPS